MGYGFKAVAANGSAIQLNSDDAGRDFFIPLQNGTLTGTSSSAATVQIPYNPTDEIDIFVNRSDITSGQWATVYHENYVPTWSVSPRTTGQFATDALNPTNDRLQYFYTGTNPRWIIQGDLYTYTQFGGYDIGGLTNGNKYYIKTNYVGNAGSDLGGYAVDFSAEANGPTGARVNLYRRTINNTQYDVPTGIHTFTNVNRTIKFIGTKGTSSNPLYHIAGGTGSFNYLLTKRVDQQGTPVGNYGLRINNSNGDLAFDSRFLTQYGTVDPQVLVSSYTRYGKFQNTDGTYPTTFSNAVSTDRTLYARITDFAGYEETDILGTYKHFHGYLFANNVSHISTRSNSGTGCWFISKTNEYNLFGNLTGTSFSYNYGGTFLTSVTNL